MRKIAFYKLETEGKLIGNYKGKDLIFFIITYFILIIPIIVVMILIPEIDIELISSNGLKINDNLVIKIFLTIVISITSTYFLTKPEKYTGESIVKTFIYPRIIYMKGTKKYSNLNKIKEKKERRILKIYWKYFKIETIILSFLIIIITSLGIYILINRYKEYESMLPIAQSYELPYVEDNILIKKSTLNKMCNDIQDQGEYFENEINVLDKVINEQKITIDETKFETSLEEYDYKTQLINSYYEDEMLNVQKEIEKYKYEYYGAFISDKNEILLDMEEYQSNYNEIETPTYQQKKDYLDKLDNTLKEFKTLLSKVDKENAKQEEQTTNKEETNSQEDTKEESTDKESEEKSKNEEETSKEQENEESYSII